MPESKNPITLPNTSFHIKPPFIAGFWLFLGLPLSGLFVFAVGSVFSMQLVIGLGDIRLILAFFLGNYIAGHLWARALLKRIDLSGYEWAPILGGTAFGATIVAGEAFGLFDLLVDGMDIRGNVPLEFSAFFVPWTGIITGSSGFALGLGLKDNRLALRLLFVGFVTGVMTFLAAIIILGFFGFQVGTPRPDGLPSMPIITIFGMWSTALIGSELFGRIIVNEYLRLDSQLSQRDRM